MNENPFQAPRVEQTLPPQPGLDGFALVIPSRTVLPRLCIVTCQPVTDDDMIRRNFYWCSPMWLLAIPFFGVLLVIVYFLVRRKCTVTYGIHPSVRRKFRRRFLLKAAVALMLLMAGIATLWIDPGDLAVVAWTLFGISIVALLLGNKRLEITKYQDNLFWVKGFAPEFLYNQSLLESLKFEDH